MNTNERRCERTGAGWHRAMANGISQMVKLARVNPCDYQPLSTINIKTKNEDGIQRKGAKVFILEPQMNTDEHRLGQSPAYAGATAWHCKVSKGREIEQQNEGVKIGPNWRFEISNFKAEPAPYFVPKKNRSTVEAWFGASQAKRRALPPREACTFARATVERTVGGLICARVKVSQAESR